MVAIVACHEFQFVLSGRNRAALGKSVSFGCFKEERRVGIYYFYILDPDWGPSFVKSLVSHCTSWWCWVVWFSGGGLVV